MTEEHISAGIIPFLEGSQRTYLLLKYPQGHWGFPKGHLEDDESNWDAARRELSEETGLDEVDRIETYKDELEYWYQHDGRDHHKIVYFFAGQVHSESVELSEEHVDYKWTSTDQTLEKITYDNERQLFQNWLEEAKKQDLAQ